MTTPKPLSVWITTNCGEFLKIWEYQTTLPISWETCMEVKKQQLELDMEQQTGSKLGKEYMKVVYCHPAYLTFMQSISCKMPGWVNSKLESRMPGEKKKRMPGETSITADMQIDNTLVAESKEELNSLLKNVKEDSEKAGLKLNIQKTKIMASFLSLHGK